MDASEASDAFAADRPKAEGKSRRPVRHRPHETSVTRKPLLIAFGYFVVLLVAIALMGPQIIDKPKPEVSAAPRDPDTFGRSTQMLADRKTCREIVFDRATNELIESVTGPCGHIRNRGVSQPSSSQPQQTFIWGKKVAPRAPEPAAAQ